MFIGDYLRQRRPSISFEFFPPKTDEGVETLMRTVKSLRILNPGFVSVTYGAGGSSRARTLEVVKRIKSELEIEPMAHLTCVGSSRDEMRAIVRELAASGIENIMALRGDPPKGEARFVPADGGFAYASELIAMLRAEFAFSLGAGAYPEMHTEAGDVAADVRIAVAKVAAGAEFLVTQFFFENDAYFAYVERLRAAGVHVPIVPGIMPITNYAGIAKMLAMNGGRMPQRLHAELEARIDEPDAVAELGVAFTALQCRELLAHGAPGLHFYTLNRSTATRAVVSALIATGAIHEATLAFDATSPSRNPAVIAR
ncbi:MAG: methylenetetrahydrofolate reductase [NAD(P)H] [Vulcanimicrobiaceae bacterium]